MRIYVTAICWLVTSPMLLAQSGRSNITGTVSDPAGAVVAGASVEARNTDTGATYPVATSATGNNTIAELPAGTYELSVTSAGFKRFIRPGLIVGPHENVGRLPWWLARLARGGTVLAPGQPGQLAGHLVAMRWLSPDWPIGFRLGADTLADVARIWRGRPQLVEAAQQELMRQLATMSRTLCMKCS